MESEVEDLGTLVRRAQDGDLAAYGELVKRFQGAALQWGQGILGDYHLAEDAVQEAFVSAYLDLGKLQQPEAFAGWFRRVVVGCCHRLVRGRRPGLIELEQIEQIAAGDKNPAELVEERDMHRRVLEALGGLPVQQRRVITLFYFNRMSQREIADLLDIPLTTANNRLHASRKRLRKELGDLASDTSNRRTQSAFVHLRGRSEYSLLGGGGRIGEVVERVAAQGMPALAVADSGNLFGAIEHYQACEAVGIKPIIGSEVEVEGSVETGTFPVVLLAKDNKGYKNLVKLVSQTATEGRVDQEILARHAEGLICMSAAARGEIGQLLRQKEGETAARAARQYRDLFAGDFYLEVQRHGGEDEVEINHGLVELHGDLGIPLVATCEFYRGEAGDEVVAEPNVKTPEEMQALFGDLPTALKNTVKIADQCNVQLGFGRVLLPDFDFPAEYENADEYLAHLAREGLEKRYRQVDPTLGARLDYELGIIRREGFSPYFLILWDCVRFARENNIAVGPGRGPSTSSLVNYCLAITDVDPVAYGLHFERFLNPERVQVPDIDIDFADTGRDRIIQYVAQKYGEKSVSQVVAFGTIGAEAAIRRVGDLLGVPTTEVEAVAGLVPQRRGVTLDQAIAEVPELEEAAESTGAKSRLIGYARKLEGLVSDPSVHPCAVVVAPGELIDYVPLDRPYKGGPIMTQFNGRACEEVGLLKLDFLGLKELSFMEEASRLIRHREPDFDLDDIALDDGDTFALFGRGETEDILYFKEPGLRDYLAELAPQDIEELMSITTLFAGFSHQPNYISEYIARKHGREPITYLHPLLKPILAITYGIVVYQEQCMSIFHTLAGLTLGQGDTLRKAVGKQWTKEVNSLKQDFVLGCKEKSIDGATARQVFAEMERVIASFSNRSHVVAYTGIGYRCAYLKTHFPQEWTRVCSR